MSGCPPHRAFWFACLVAVAGLMSACGQSPSADRKASRPVLHYFTWSTSRPRLIQEFERRER